MSNLLFLSASDFNIKQGTKGLLLCHEMQHVSLVLFYSPRCSYCAHLIPIFKSLPKVVSGCQFAMINVSLNKNVVDMSHQTVAPIKYVPYIVLYVNGSPYLEYKGEYNLELIRDFIIDTYKHIQNNVSFTQKQKHPNIHVPDTGLATYSLGSPLYGDGLRCYIEFDGAYEKQKQQQRRM